MCTRDGAQGLLEIVQHQLSLGLGYTVFTPDLFVHQASISHLHKMLGLKRQMIPSPCFGGLARPEPVFSVPG